VAWEVEYSDEFAAWWDTLDEDEQEDVDAIVQVLEAKGVALGAPYSSDIKGARNRNMRELKVQHKGRPYRVLYAFDPRRTAMLLIGGDKTGDSRWYEKFVPTADDIYDAHVAQLKREGLISG
jgi:hypothetical protein